MVLISDGTAWLCLGPLVFSLSSALLSASASVSSRWSTAFPPDHPLLWCAFLLCVKVTTVSLFLGCVGAGLSSLFITRQNYSNKGTLPSAAFPAWALLEGEKLQNLPFVPSVSVEKIFNLMWILCQQILIKFSLEYLRFWFALKVSLKSCVTNTSVWKLNICSSGSCWHWWCEDVSSFSPLRSW